uniref:Uncharacterized protein C17H9.11 n=1 Tax=Lygus hesperus TaxID=30085 RepID=A0A0A9X402_LYGHE
MKRFAKCNIHTITFKVELGVVEVDKKLDQVDYLEEVVKHIPADRPRFVLTHHGKSCEPQRMIPVLVYICPLTCTPKERMTYAASKACFLRCAKQHAGTFHHRIDVGSRDEFIAGVHDALKINHRTY